MRQMHLTDYENSEEDYVEEMVTESGQNGYI